MKFAIRNALGECLAEKNIRQWQLARRLRMSRAYVCRLCSGGIKPSIVAALRIAHCLGKPVDQIFILVDENNVPLSPTLLGSIGEHITNKAETVKGKNKCN